MKFKSCLKFLTGTVVVSTLAIVIINILQKKVEVSHDVQLKNSNVDEVLNKEDHIENQPDEYTTKKTVGIAIAERHEQASLVIDEAVSNIKSVEKHNNDKAFDELTNDLESLLK